MVEMEQSQKNVLSLQMIHNLSQMCAIDESHAQQVKNLSLTLFEQLNPIFKLSTIACQWLEFAALLHDIGWVQGQSGHHKATLEIILSTPLLDFENKERLIIGSIARYHRKALPSKRHDHFAVLEANERIIVRKLAMILRLANSMDSSHQSIVIAESVTCRIKKDKMMITCQVRKKPIQEKLEVRRVIPLMKDLTGKSISVRWVMV